MKNFTVEIGPEQTSPPGGRVRRAPMAVKNLVSKPDPSVSTLYDLLQYSTRKYGDKKAFGYRKVEEIIEEEKEVTKIVDGVEQTTKKTWKFFQLSPFNYITYKSASRLTQEIGSGYVHLGLKEKAKVEIFAPTSVYWMMTAHGLFTQNMTIVTAYDTLGEEGLLHSMNETEVEAIFTSGELLPTVANVVEKCPTVKFVVYHGEATPEAIASVKKGTVQRVLSFDEVARLGRNNPNPARPPQPSDLCCIMYTSGSTGNPKGVILKHSNIVAAVGAANALLSKHVTSRDAMIAYLPLAHILEFVVENVCIFWGVSLGYGAVRTLTDASVRNCKGDIKEFRPTIMTGVPAVWESIRKGVLAKVNALPPRSQKVFHKAFATKAWLLERNLPTGVIDKAVLGKIREQVGGRLRFALSGGAPLSVETQKFLSITLCPILGGYGMTESCGMCGVMPPEAFAYGQVGVAVPCCEVKLVDVPDANYFSTNKPRPQGEIWVRGPSITEGYWKRDDVTRETLTEDGWLQTGDIGEWNANGTLTIIDRKKNLVKLSNGEYIALEKLESIYKGCIYLSNICVYADSLCSRPVAIAVPLEVPTRELAKKLGIHDEDWEVLCSNEELKSALLKNILAHGKQSDLKSAELLFDVRLASEEWTVESGLLTAAQKLKRQDIVKRYKSQLDEMNAAQPK